MPVALLPQAWMSISRIPVTDGLQVSPPVVFQTLAADWNAESGTSIDGRFTRSLGEAEANAVLKPQDTFKTGSSGMTGEAYTVLAGTVRDDWVSPQTGRHGLLVPNQTAAAQFDVQATAEGEKLTHREVIVGRGEAPVGVTPNAATVYATLELCNTPDQGGYRVALEYGRPIRLDYLAPGAATWQAVALAREIGNVEGYLANNDRHIRMRVKPNTARGVMVVEIGEDAVLRHAPSAGLPQSQRYRLSGQNGWASLSVCDLRYEPLTVTKSATPYGQVLPVGSAEVYVNAAGQSADGVTVAPNVSQDAGMNVGWTVTATGADAGDGLGSEEPPTLSDVTVRIPAVWGAGWPWYETPYRPRVMHVHEVQVFDDIGRRMAASASVRINNRWGDMSGVFGNFSATLTASNGAGWAVQRLRGVLAGSPGLQVSRQDPARYAEGVIHDPSYKLRRPLGQEIILDGWCIYSAVRLLMEIGQIHPDFLVNIPWYPYGPAGTDCPYPILGRGTGLSPKFRFMPDATVMGVLSDLVQDAGCVDPITGVSVPYFWGFDRWGQAHFEPFDPRGLPVATWYTDTDLTGLHRIEEIQVINSIEDLRTEITFQGHDALTNELLNLHVPLPANLAAVGFNYPWFERNSRWSSEEYVGRLMGSAVNAASLPGQIVRMLVPFDPNVFAGQLVGVRERQALGGSGLFVITGLESRYGLMDATGRHGEQECHSIVTARAAETLMPA